MSIGIVWFRQDLRLADNQALARACAENDTVLPLFIDDPLASSVSQLGDASRVWLHHSLAHLDESLRSLGSGLLLAQGPAQAVLQRLAEHTGASHLYWNRCYDPASVERDSRIKRELANLSPQSFQGSLLFEPTRAVKADGTPYRVYTPFWRAFGKHLPGDAPVGAPTLIPDAAGWLPRLLPEQATLESLALLPALEWPDQMMSHWQVGELAAMEKLQTFLAIRVQHYRQTRDLPAEPGTSGLSPHLHFGEISPRQILHELAARHARWNTDDSGAQTFARELVWREFAYALLYHFPHTVTDPLDPRFERFKWADEYSEELHAWQRGQSGVPIVDAGMRQLYATGWMHNRVRMVVASYLIKNLLVPWQEGERWFRNTLVDADLASNVMGWQWAAGSGADAAPFFRIFNPVLQGEKFDKAGEYVKHWVPELTSLGPRQLHKPWELATAERAALGYPAPRVELKASRQRALDAFARLKG